MKNLITISIILSLAWVYACNKDENSARFNMLTDPVWITDSLLADGVNAGGPGGLLEKFKGEAKFKSDGTGYFGEYTGQWRFNQDETEITIVTDSLGLPIICDIAELTRESLKINTVVPNPFNTQDQIDIRMTFKAR